MVDTTSARAVLFTAAGATGVVEVGGRQVRAPAAGEVRLRVDAATVNPTDLLLRERGADGLSPPLTPGMDAAGTIEAVGEGVERFAVGDAVTAVVSPSRDEGGAQAQLVVVPVASVVAIPKGMKAVDAATLPMNALTALYALASVGHRRVIVSVSGFGELHTGQVGEVDQKPILESMVACL